MIVTQFYIHFVIGENSQLFFNKILRFLNIFYFHELLREMSINYFIFFLLENVSRYEGKKFFQIIFRQIAFVQNYLIFQSSFLNFRKFAFFEVNINFLTHCLNIKRRVVFGLDFSYGVEEVDLIFLRGEFLKYL